MSMDQDKKKSLEKKAKALGLGKKKKHILICTGPKCVDEDKGFKVWDHLKEKLKDSKYIEINRLRAGCLRLCENGPIAVVYPEGTWYGCVKKDIVDRIVDEHLLAGHIVTENVIDMQ